MNKEKQIEEMAKITCQMYRRDKEKKCAGVQECDCKCLQYNRCEALYNAGYRKASEVAWEIFEDIVSIWKKGRGFIKYTDLVDLERIYENKYSEGAEQCGK